MLIYKKMIRLSSPHYMLGRRHTASLACSTLHTYKRTQTHFIGTHADTDAHYHWRTVQAGWEKEREGRRKGWRGRMLRHREVIILGCACAHTHTATQHPDTNTTTALLWTLWPLQISTEIAKGAAAMMRAAQERARDATTARDEDSQDFGLCLKSQYVFWGQNQNRSWQHFLSNQVSLSSDLNFTVSLKVLLIPGRLLLTARSLTQQIHLPLVLIQLNIFRPWGCPLSPQFYFAW